MKKPCLFGVLLCTNVFQLRMVLPTTRTVGHLHQITELNISVAGEIRIFFQFDFYGITQKSQQYVKNSFFYYSLFLFFDKITCANKSNTALNKSLMVQM